MSEPRRLREANDNSFERAILDAGASYRSSDEAKARTLAALGLAGTALVSVAAASSSSSLFGKLSLGKLLAIVSVGAAAAVPVGYWAFGSQSEPLSPPLRAPMAKSAPPAPPVARPNDAAPTSTLEVAAAPVASVARVETIARAESAAGTRANKPENKASSSGALLTGELGALDAARGALAKGEARRALALLDAYQKSYPRGRLALEAEVLRIDALARSGETQAAKQRAAAFVRRHPSSVLSTRVRGYLDG